MKKYFIKSKNSECPINLEDKEFVKKLNRFFILELKGQKYYEYENNIFSTATVPSGNWYQDYLIYVDTLDKFLDEIANEMDKIKNILNIYNYSNPKPIVHFVKSARKDYPEDGIKKGQSYWWIKKDRFSKKQRFSKKP